MKKIIFLCVLFLLSSRMVNAQLELRPFVGITSSSLDNIGDVEFKEKVGFSFGADLMIGKRFYVQPGFHYEGVQNKARNPSADQETDLKVNRVRIPLLVGYKLFNPDTDRIFNIRLFTGPNASFVTNVDDGESQLDIDKEDFKNTVFGWNAGAGLDILIFFVDFGYQFGLSDVFEDLNIQGIEGANSKNNVFHLNAGVRIRF